MPPPDSHSSGFSPGRRWLTTLNLLLATAAALALVVMLNYLADGPFQTLPVGRCDQFQTLPPDARAS